MHTHSHTHAAVNVQTTVIDDSDWTAVCNYLQKIDKRQILHLGAMLGLCMFNLERMQNLPDDLVKAWLRKEDRVRETSGDPLTWEALVKALQGIGQRGIADDITRDKCTGQSNA